MNARALFAALLFSSILNAAASAQEKTSRLKLLFLGDNGHHRPAERFRQLEPVLRARGIEMVYTDGPAALNPQTLGKYDGLIVYANTEKITDDQEKALLDFVASGKGFIPIHCASYCFLNSTKYVELVGAQFQRHGTGTFRTTIANQNHPLMKGFRGFESWDETYVHARHNDKDRTVLEFRQEGNKKEPWTWVRTHGKGRVFYTAWGHDERTWSNPGFHNLVERGIRWAVGADPGVVPAFTDQIEMTTIPKGLKPFEYVDAKLPYYPGGKAGPFNKMQKPLAPEESMKHIVHPIDFELQLFVSEPNIKRPICMNWDERGRLWIAESVDYPNDRQPEGKGNDRIVICEDTDGDGKADKFTVFADGLSIPTGFTFANGGIIVVQAPQTLFLKSTKGDDKADIREILFTGWGTGDTHAGPSNLHYGFDNWIYGVCGYSGFQGTVGGEKLAFNQGFFRFKPDGGKLEFLRSTNNNTWGLGFSEEGHIFGSTANGNPSEHLAIPNRYYEQVKGWSSRVLTGIAGNAPMHPITDKVRQVDFHGHFTAAAGHALYTARAYPKEYWNKIAFVCEPTGHLVAAFEITPDGAGFRSRNKFNLVASDDEWFAPIMAEVGPDGCVWILDWYNYIVQHNPTPPGFKNGKGNAYETPLRDKTHGRVYRLVPKNAKLPPPITLKDASPEKLVMTLSHENMLWRKHAQRLLVERGKKDVVELLARLYFGGHHNMDKGALAPQAIHVLWTIHGLKASAEDNQVSRPIGDSLRHPSAMVRRTGYATLPRTAQGLEYLVGSIPSRDPDAGVRLAALLAMTEMPITPGLDLAAAVQLMAILEADANLQDRWIMDGVIAAAVHFQKEFLFRQIDAPARKVSPGALVVIEKVAENLARVESDGIIPVLRAMSQTRAEAPLIEAVLAGLAKGTTKNRKLELSEMENNLIKLLPRLSSTARGHLIQLGNRWGSQAFAKHSVALVEEMLQTLGNEKHNDAQRLSAARQAIEFRPTDAKIVETLLDAVTPRSSPTLAAGLLEAIGDSQSAAVGKLVLKRLPTFSPHARLAALRVLLRRPDSTRAFLDAIDKGQAQFGDLTLEQKQALASHPEPALAERARKLLERGGGLPSPDRVKVIEHYLHVTTKSGDAAAGKAIFKKVCATCHVHGGEGNKIGPDLTGVAVHSKEHLLTDILDPNRSVEGNYRVYIVTTDDGKVMNGLLASESKTAIELYDAEGKKHVLLRENIEQLISTTKSLMPEGFEKQLKESELIDLLTFLTQRGKFLPLPLAKAATIVSTRGMFYSEEAEAERLIFKDWSPKVVEGVPFHLVDPQGDRTANAILLYSPYGKLPPKMPKSVHLPVGGSAKAIHFLSGVSGWGYPYGDKGGVVMTVRLHYADGKTEDHDLKNGEHFADYIRRIDVPGSKFAFALRGQQLRYLAIFPQRAEAIDRIELRKGPDPSAPVVMAVTVETR